MHVPLAAGAAAGAGTGVWVFSYNRENFQYDAGRRFGRFMAARGYAIAQVGQYREDLHGLTNMTSAKADTWATVCTLFMCVCAALSCAGRIGMHGPAPPNWLCALYSGNIFAALMFSGLALWLSMHASQRAQAEMTRLLTRKVRLPIPSLTQMDQARVVASSFEQQNWGDVFRVPFMQHPQDAPDLPPSSVVPEDPSGKDGDKMPFKTRTKKEEKPFESSNRDSVPSWIRDEQVMDKLSSPHWSGPGYTRPAGDAPEHFKEFTKAMETWWQYDVYSRISMLYCAMSFLFALSYYCIGTTISELRGFWISWSLPMLLMTAQALILRLDIFQDRGSKMLPSCEWFGHVAPYVAVAGTTLEYQLFSSPGLKMLTWLIVIFCFFCHMMFALRMLDLAWPDLDLEVDMKERPTKQWWPKQWMMPTSFSKALWLIAPPKKLEPGQHCLMHEMEDLQRGASRITACRRRKKGSEVNGRSSTSAATKNIQALKSKCQTLDEHFEKLHVDTWMRLSIMQQDQVRDLHDKYQELKGEIQEAGQDGNMKHEALEALADDLDDVEDFITHLTPEVVRDVSEVTFEFGARKEMGIPWKIMRTAIGGVAFQWFFMIIASLVEWQMSPFSLLKPPGEPPWIRDTKYREWTPEYVHLSNNATYPAGYSLFQAPKYRPPHPEREHPKGDDADSVGHGGGHSDPGHRRLSDAYSRRPDVAMAELLKALPEVASLLDVMKQEDEASVDQPSTQVPQVQPVLPPFLSSAPKPRRISWPPLFEARQLLCGNRSAVALTQHGFGALLPLDTNEAVEAQPFALHGLGHHSPLAGAAWAAAGLQLVTRAGDLLNCPGISPVHPGMWPCHPQHGPKLPLPEGALLLAAAIGEPAASGLGRTAALLLQDQPSIVGLFEEDSRGAGWNPAGEVHLPTLGELVHLSLAGNELIVTSGDGSVHGRHIKDGTLRTHATGPVSDGGVRDFYAACMLPTETSKGNSVLRLALKQVVQSDGGIAWGPELFS